MKRSIFILSLVLCSACSNPEVHQPRPAPIASERKIELYPKEKKAEFLAKLEDTVRILRAKKGDSTTLERLRERILASDDRHISLKELLTKFKIERSSNVLFTGYYRPILNGSFERKAPYLFPLYRRPARLRSPHPRRAEIAELLKGEELVFVDSALEAFLAQVQGSTDVSFADGSIRHYRFAGATDFPYTSIGAELIRDGKLKKGEAALPQIKGYFELHPEELENYLNRNDRFVFFKEAERKTIGSLGVELPELSSLAVDPSVYPLGSAVIYRARLPMKRELGWGEEEVLRVALCLDTGSAIKGSGRADIYIGSGVFAGEIAGRLKSEGSIYLLKGALENEDLQGL